MKKKRVVGRKEKKNKGPRAKKSGKKSEVFLFLFVRDTDHYVGKRGGAVEGDVREKKGAC